MKIEIVPEGNSTKNGKGDWNISWIFDLIFGSVKSFVDTIFESIATGVEDVVSRAVRLAFAVLLGMIGLWFLLNGFAKFLNFLYGAPGVGDILVGSLVFLVAVIVAAFIKKK